MDIKTLYSLSEKTENKTRLEKFLRYQYRLELNDSFFSVGLLPHFRYKNDIHDKLSSGIDLEKSLYSKIVTVDKSNELFNKQYDLYSSELEKLEGINEFLGEKIDKVFIDSIIKNYLSETQRDLLFKDSSLDFSINTQGLSFRVNIAFADNGASIEPFIVIRKIMSKPFTLKQMGVTETILEKFKAGSGLLLISGPTGSAKSSTLTSIVDYYNNFERKNIICLEDPIEFFWKKEKWKNCMIFQREIGRTVPTFHEGIRSALRENPDVIIVWEIRDKETVEAAIEAANAGILVIATIHVKSTTEVLSRVLGFFEWDKVKEVSTKLSGCLNFVMNQRFLRDYKWKARILYEWLDTTKGGIPNLIQKNNLDQVRNSMKELNEEGQNPHKTLSESLMELIVEGHIAEQHAIEKFINEPVHLFKEELKTYKKIYSSKQKVSLEKIEEIIETANIFYNKKREW